MQRRYAAIALMCLFSIGCRTGGQPESAVDHGPGKDSLSAWAEFEYLKDSTRMVVTVTRDSTIVDRRNSADSCVSLVRTANGDTARRHFDSLRVAFGRVKPGEYRKEHVIDGTRMRVRHDGQEVYCDNCLHDFVLEAVGVATGGAPRSAYLIRDAIGYITDMVLLAEGEHRKGMSKVHVIVDPRQMKDSTRAYEVDIERDSVSSTKEER